MALSTHFLLLLASGCIAATRSTSHAHCRDGQISTGFDNTGGEDTEARGVMFDLERFSGPHDDDEVTIVAFDLNVERTRTLKLEVFTKLGTHAGHEAFQEGEDDDDDDDSNSERDRDGYDGNELWTRVGDRHRVEGQGEDAPSRLTLDRPVPLPPPGQRQAFYIRQVNRDDIQTLDQRRRAKGSDVVHADDIVMLYVGTGIGVGSLKGNVVPGLTLSGTIIYRICSKTQNCEVKYSNWIGDGHCDRVGGYNTLACGWDGGDCCGTTCVNGPVYACESSNMDCLIPDAETPHITYKPGELTKEENGLLLSTGLQSRIIAKSGKRVTYADGTESNRPFHGRPDGAAVFPHPNGVHWVYVSNSEEKEVGAGGVGALTFNEEGKTIDYRMILVNTTKNCSGGRTPWNTFVSCEETTGKGQIFEVDPFGHNLFDSDQGRRTWQRTELAAIDNGDRYEAVACDNRDPMRPIFYITNDKEDGEVRRFTPDIDAMKLAVASGDYRHVLSTVGTIEYLVLSPDLIMDEKVGSFQWESSRRQGQRSAKKYHQNCEGIEFNEQNGKLYFVSKSHRELFVLDVDGNTYTKVSTKVGSYVGQPDQLKLCALGDEQMLYFSEEGGGEGIHARDAEGHFLTILQGIGYDGETTGIAFSPDKRHMYFSQWELGHIFDITREDGYPFSGEALPLSRS